MTVSLQKVLYVPALLCTQCIYRQKKKHNVEYHPNSILIICTTQIDALRSFERVQWRHDGNKSFLARLERTTSEILTFVQSCNFFLVLSTIVLRCVHLVFLQRKCLHLVHLGNMWEDVSTSKYPSHARTRTPRPITIGRSARAGCFYYAQDATSHLQTSRPCAGTGTVGGCRPAEMLR
jgi:hypothetical protein